MSARAKKNAAAAATAQTVSEVPAGPLLRDNFAFFMDQVWEIYPDHSYDHAVKTAVNFWGARMVIATIHQPNPEDEPEMHDLVVQVEFPDSSRIWLTAAGDAIVLDVEGNIVDDLETYARQRPIEHDGANVPAVAERLQEQAGDPPTDPQVS